LDLAFDLDRFFFCVFLLHNGRESQVSECKANPNNRPKRGRAEKRGPADPGLMKNEIT
jgi:hypothetical protein